MLGAGGPAVVASFVSVCLVWRTGQEFGDPGGRGGRRTVRRTPISSCHLHYGSTLPVVGLGLQGTKLVILTPDLRPIKEGQKKEKKTQTKDLTKKGKISSKQEGL